MEQSNQESESSGAATVGKKSTPQIAVTKTGVDSLFEVRSPDSVQGITNKFALEVVNLTKVEWSDLEFRTTCGCVRIAFENKSLKPSDKLFITVTVQIGSGSYSQPVKVFGKIGDSRIEQPIFILNFTGVCRPIVTLKPQKALASKLFAGEKSLKIATGASWLRLDVKSLRFIEGDNATTCTFLGDSQADGVTTYQFSMDRNSEIESEVQLNGKAMGHINGLVSLSDGKESLSFSVPLELLKSETLAISPSIITTSRQDGKQCLRFIITDYLGNSIDDLRERIVFLKDIDTRAKIQQPADSWELEVRKIAEGKYFACLSFKNDSEFSEINGIEISAPGGTRSIVRVLGVTK